MTANPSGQETLNSRFPNVAFGTSGVRALVSALTPEAVFAYVYAFVERMRHTASLSENRVVLVGIDLRPSSPAIAEKVCGALRALGLEVEYSGTLPTPALALRCLALRAPGVMVTGSHIPYDRNGIKFYSPLGEILKDDELAIFSCPIPDDFLAHADDHAPLPAVSHEATNAYVERYLRYFGKGSLVGRRVGLYEHSAVGRDLTRKILTELGAEVVPLGRSDGFIPIDTEAVRDTDLELARVWCKTHALDAVVSTDGDGDRPLVFDEHGDFVRGDLLGLLCSRTLGIGHVVAPVSCNTALEISGAFESVVRTKIGSPFVIAQILELNARSTANVAGFEANGGYLLGTSLPGLDALPTRDALLPMLALLAQSVRNRVSISVLIGRLPGRYTFSDRLKDFAPQRSRELLTRVESDAGLRQLIAGKDTDPERLDVTDGVRWTFPDGDVVHLRASGNAPELRCYAESVSPAQAEKLCRRALDLIQSTTQ